MSDRLLLRKDPNIKAVSSAPSINKTPVGSEEVPLPYQVIADLSNAVGCAEDVRFNGMPAFVLGESSQPECHGDDAGTGKGVRSGTVNGECTPTAGSPTALTHGKPTVRQDDTSSMQGGNADGTYVTVPRPAPPPPEGSTTFAFDPPLEAPSKREAANAPQARQEAAQKQAKLKEQLSRPGRKPPQDRAPEAVKSPLFQAGDQANLEPNKVLAEMKADAELRLLDSMKRADHRQWAFLEGCQPVDNTPQMTDGSKPRQLSWRERVEADYRAAFQAKLDRYNYYTHSAELVTLGGLSRGHPSRHTRRQRRSTENAQRVNPPPRPEFRRSKGGGYVPPREVEPKGSDGPNPMDGIAKNIHPGAQGKHIVGDKNYIPGRSTIDAGVDPQTLLDGAHSGKYPVVGTGARGQPIVDFGKPIGVDAGSGLKTQYGTIHSGKHGAHIVPANPKRKAGGK